jgi:hypothetical protein
MMSDILFPIGRLVAGSLYTPNTKDFQGNQLTIKSGPNAGQPRQEYFFACAIPKGTEQNWWETEWGAKMYQEAATAWPNGEYGQQGFAWKVVNGDSQQPNRRGTVPASLPGYAGHWVVNFSSSYPPKITADNGSRQLIEENAVKPGYYIQVYGDVAGNKTPGNPGIFVNHKVVNLAGYGEEISTGVDPSHVGFGGNLPAGASQTPVGGGFNPAPQGMPGQQAPQGMPGQQAPQGMPGQQAPQGMPGQQAPQQGAGYAPHPGFANPRG